MLIQKWVCIWLWWDPPFWHAGVNFSRAKFLNWFWKKSFFILILWVVFLVRIWSTFKEFRLFLWLFFRQKKKQFFLVFAQPLTQSGWSCTVEFGYLDHYGYVSRDYFHFFHTFIYCPDSALPENHNLGIFSCCFLGLWKDG